MMTSASFVKYRTNPLLRRYQLVLKICGITCKYHKNIREATCPTVRNSGDATISTLTFSLSVGEKEIRNFNSSSSRDQMLKICKECWDELEKLNILHEQLEEVKNSMDAQVLKIDNRRKNLGRDDDSDLITRNIPAMQLAMAKSVQGREKALQFLGNICHGMSPLTPEPASIANPEPAPIRHDKLHNGLQISTRDAYPLYAGPETPHASAGTTLDPEPKVTFHKLEPLDEISISEEFVKSETQEDSDQLEYNFEDEDPSEDDDFMEVTNSVPQLMGYSLPVEHSQPIQDPLEVSGSCQYSKAASVITSSSDGDWTTCSVCGDRVKGVSLKGHMRRHTGERPYACEFCDRRFTQPGALARHRRTHTGEKPHSCDICQRRFSSSYGVKNHERIRHGIVPNKFRNKN